MKENSDSKFKIWSFLSVLLENTQKKSLVARLKES